MMEHGHLVRIPNREAERRRPSGRCAPLYSGNLQSGGPFSEPTILSSFILHGISNWNKISLLSFLIVDRNEKQKYFFLIILVDLEV